MDTTSISEEIEQTRNRLDEIDERRSELPEQALDEREDLKDEENRLEAHLGELLEQAGKEETGMAEKKASDQTDLTRTPPLPPT